MSASAFFARAADAATPARGSETAARLFFATALFALVFALWAPNLDVAAAWTEKFLRVMPRMTVFVTAALAALVIQGGHPGSRFLLLAGGALALLQALLLPFADFTQPIIVTRENSDALRQYTEVFQSQPAARGLLLSGAVLDLLRFESAVLSAVLLGAWLGCGLKTGGHFLMLLLCAISGDVWMSSFRIAETADTHNVLSLLRVPWPPALGSLGLSPAWPDLLVISAIIAAARPLRFHLLSIVLGAVAGYCGAAFLALGPWPAWPALSMSMCASGILMGSWPDLKCSARDSAQAVGVAAVLFLILMGSALLQKRLNPPPGAPEENVTRYRNVA